MKEEDDSAISFVSNSQFFTFSISLFHFQFSAFNFQLCFRSISVFSTQLSAFHVGGRGEMILRALLIFPRNQFKAGIGTWTPRRTRGRLPWLLRASPSATQHETVI